MNKNEDLENKDDLILDVNQPLTSEQMVEDNTETENPRGDTLRTDIQGTDTFSEPSQAAADATAYLNKFKQFSDPDSMTTFEKGVDKLGDQIYDFHHEMEMDLNPAKWAYASMWGALDVPFDVIGAIPGLGGIDDTWDSVTGFNNEGAKQFRSAASVIVPSIVSGGEYAKQMGKQNFTYDASSSEFIDYKDLKESDVLGWIWKLAKEDDETAEEFKARIESERTAKVQGKIDRKAAQVTGLPW